MGGTKFGYTKDGKPFLTKEPKFGLAAGERALALARQCGHPLLTAFVSQIHCNVLIEQRRPPECLALAEEALRLSREQFLVFWVAGLTITGGWGRAFTTDVAPGIEQLRTGIANWKSTGAALHLPTWNPHLAEAFLLADLTEEAASVMGCVDDCASQWRCCRFGGTLPVERTGPPSADASAGSGGSLSTCL